MTHPITPAQYVQRMEMLTSIRRAQAEAVAALRLVVETAARREDLFLDTETGAFGEPRNRMLWEAYDGLGRVSKAFDEAYDGLLAWEPDHR